MVLEAIMVCLDNSEWSRNGDFAPSRWDSQIDAGNIICEAKTQQNPENTLGIMAYAGRRVDIKLTQTNDISSLLNAIATVDISKLDIRINQKFLDGEADFINAIKVAQLSLKHRQNKSQRQRIIIFVGHPLNGDEAHFEELGVRMKRNSVAVDVINFAHPENVPKLQSMVNAANSNGNSHFLDVPLGVAMITDILITSPIINEDVDMGGAGAGGVGAGVGGAPGGSQFADYGGIDPNLDPELAMALRISMEEARANQAQDQPAAAQQQQPPAAQVDQQQPAAQVDVAMQQDDEEEDEATLLAKALAISNEQKPEQADMKDILADNEFLQDIAKELGIDNIDIVEGQQKTEEQKKKEEEDRK